MKQKFKFDVWGLLFNVTMAFLLAFVIAPFAPPDLAKATFLGITVGGTVLFSLPYQTTSFIGAAAFDGLRTEVWVPEIAPLFFPDNEFVSEGVNEDVFVDNDKVTRANKNGVPKVKKNRNELPARIHKAKDDPNSYDLEEYTSDPDVIPNRDEMEFNYNYRQAVLSGHIDQINTLVATDMAIKWATTQPSRIIPTSGSDRVTESEGGTGNRKACTIQDLRKLHRILDRDNVPVVGRIAVLPSAFYEDIYDELLGQFTDRVIVTDQQIREATGFEKIYKRSKVVQYSAGLGSLRAMDEDGNFKSTAASDRMAAIAFHKKCVGRAKGSIIASVSEYREEYYGHIVSGLLRAGGKPIYTTQKGMAAIAEVS